MIKISNIKGFTLVEMMVVVAVLGILMALTAFATRGWQQSIEQRQVRSDLTMAATAMESAKNFGSGYPVALPGTFKAASGVLMQFIWGDGSQYCIQASSKKLTSIVYFVDSSQSKDPQLGSCPASPYPPATPSPSAVATSSSAINVTWASVAGATSYVVRYGTGSPTTVAACTGSPCALTGLNASTLYNVTVTASNANGSSPAGTTSATTQAPAVTIPPTPSAVAVDVTGSTATVSWSQVSGASYDVQKKLTASSTWDSSVSKITTSHQYTGLTIGTSYDYRVRAANSAGTSAWSATITRVTVAAPTNLTGQVTEVGQYDIYSDYSKVTIYWTSAAPSLASYYETSMGNVANPSSGPKSATSDYITYPAQTYGPLYQTFTVRAVAPDGARSDAASVTVQYN